MKAAWRHKLWLKEPRAAEIAYTDVEPVTSVHAAWMKQGPVHDPMSFSTACAAGHAGRKLAKRFDLDHVSCVYGEAWPSCRHVTWHCPDTSLPAYNSPPANGVEERLLVRSVAPAPWPPDTVPEDMLPPVEVCNCFASQEVQLDGRILVATDGSSHSCHSLKRAAWGIATENHVFAFPMKGCDQNIFAAETWAVFQALNAAHVTGRNVRILCDTSRCFHSRAGPAWWVTAALGLWHLASHCFSQSWK